MKADIYQEAFRDFESSATTDGSYLGINKAAKETTSAYENEDRRKIKRS